ATMCLGDYIDIVGECFHFSEDELSWDKAQAACKKRGDQLAVPGDVDAFLSDIAKFNRSGFSFVGGRKDPRGLWKWINGNHVPLNPYWMSNQPHNGDNMDCLGIRFEVTKLTNQRCSVLKEKYICQKLTESFDYTIYVVCFIVLFLLFLAFTISIYIYRRRKQSQSILIDSTATTNPSFERQPTRHESENSLYGQSVPMGEIRISGRHDSENSIYGKL
ncbi:unnamed protein product, partial [Meganyctiphanes norvegica]